MKRRALLLASAASAVGLLAFLLSRPSGPGPVEGAPAPAFALTDLTGRTVTLADYRGQVVLVDFWATWCPSCEAELPDLKAIHGRLKESGFALLAVSVDEAGPEVVARYAAAKSMPWTVLFANDDAAKAYRVFALPTKFLIGRDGAIVKRYLEVPDPKALENDIMAQLNRRPA
jgi:peroxiredoxin